MEVHPVVTVVWQSRRICSTRSMTCVIQHQVVLGGRTTLGHVSVLINCATSNSAGFTQKSHNKVPQQSSRYVVSKLDTHLSSVGFSSVRAVQFASVSFCHRGLLFCSVLFCSRIQLRNSVQFQCGHFRSISQYREPPNIRPMAYIHVFVRKHSLMGLWTALSHLLVMS